jgi:hypothetical protein
VRQPASSPPGKSRADQDISRRFCEVAVILAVHEQEIDADRGRSTLHDIGHPEEEGHSRAAIVGAHDCVAGIPRSGAVGHRPAVPVRQQKQALLSCRVEARDKVAKLESVSRRSDVFPALHHDGIGARPQQAVQPVPHFLVRRSSRNAGAERHLGLDVTEGGTPGEFLRRASLFPAGEDAKNGDRGEGGEGAVTQVHVAPGRQRGSLDRDSKAVERNDSPPSPPSPPVRLYR